MKRILLTTTLGTALVAGSGQAAVFEFNQQGYLGGGVLSGFFEGEDLNGDGQIVSFQGEVTDLSANFQGVDFSGETISTSFSGGSLLGGDAEVSGFTGLVYSLDGRGTIGDDERGAVEGLGLNNGEFAISVGPGPAELCDGVNDCGFLTGPGVLIDGPSEGGSAQLGSILSSSSEVINVTSGPLGTPLGSADRPFLPDDNPFNEEDEDEDGFVFEIFEFEVQPFQTFFIDPDIAVGYTYTITGSSFTSVTAPTLAQVNDANAEYILTAPNLSTTIASGDMFSFATGGVSEFSLTGIDVDPGLDPTDPTAFITGVSVGAFTGNSIIITQTPIVQATPMPSPVPLPAGILLLAPGLLALRGLGRRKS